MADMKLQGGTLPLITSWVRKEWADLRPEHPLLAKVA